MDIAKRFPRREILFRDTCKGDFAQWQAVALCVLHRIFAFFVEKIDVVAARMMQKFRPAFEELAK